MNRTAFAAALLVCAAAFGQDASPAKGGSEYFPVAKGDVLLIVGDSIGGPRVIIPMIRKAYPQRDIWCINASIGGNTLRDAVGRLDRDVIRSDLGPDADVNWVVIMFGANDSGVMDAKTYESYYRKLIEAVKRRTRAHVILVATPAFTKEGRWYAGRTKRIGEFLDVVRKLGREYSLAVVDLYNPSLAYAKEHGNEAFAKDGIHPTAEAHKFMAETFLRQFSFYGLSEPVEVDLGAKTAKGTDGCEATLEPGAQGLLLVLVNRYDFPRKVGVRLAGAEAFDVYDDEGKKLTLEDGRFVVEVPSKVNLLDGGDAAVRRAVRQGRTCTVRIVPAGRPFMAIGGGLSIPFFDVAAACRDQFTDLRVNFPKSRLRRHTGGLRDAWGLARAGDVAAKPAERVEVLFINHDAPSASGEVRVASLPAKGWRAKAATPTTFKNLKQGERFLCEFELTGDAVCTYEGEMTVVVDLKLAGVAQPTKEMRIRLCAPWLGVGTFCDTAERDKASIAEKFGVIYAPEKTIDPAAAYRRFDGKTLHWKPFRSMWCYPGMERAGEISWTARMTGAKEAVFTPWQPPGVLYAVRWVHAPEARDVKLLPVFSSRAAKLWINDRLVIDTINPDEKEWHQNRYGMNWSGWLKTDYYGAKTVDAKLKKGWNVVVFKLLSNSRPWNCADMLDLRILDRDGRAFPDVWGACVPAE